MLKGIVVCITLVLAVLVVPVSPAIGGVLLDDQFDGPLNPAIWTLERGDAWTQDDWLVCQAGSGNSTVVTAGEGSAWSDYTFRTRFFAETVGGQPVHMAFVFFRVEDYHGSDEGRFYYTWISTPLSGSQWNIGLDRHTESGSETIAYVQDPAYVNDHDNVVEVALNGGHIVIRINDQVAVDIVDPTPVLTGGIALGSAWNCRTRFDYARIEGASFTDVTAGPLLNVEDTVAAAWGDYDNDGDEDLYLANYYDHSSRLYRNDGNGSFTDVTTASLLSGTGYGHCAAWADYDNDGDLDLYLANYSLTNKLFRNDGNGDFVDATTGPLAGSGHTVAAAWGDYDNDGDVDLYLAHYPEAANNKLLRNEGSGIFTDVTTGPLGGLGGTANAIWGDYDNDGDVDLYLVSTAETPNNRLLRNDGSGAFTDVTTSLLLGPGGCEGASWGDYDNDGDLDLFLARADGTPGNKLLRNNGKGNFSDVTTAALAGLPKCVAGSWGDYDNDGDLDLYLANHTLSNTLLRNDGGGIFLDATEGALGDVGFHYAAPWCDFDNDGDLDLFLVRHTQANRLLRNEIGNQNHWLHVKLAGTESNGAGIGARVRVVAGGVARVEEVAGGGTWGQNSLVAEFGLGAATTMADTVQVRWPSSYVQTLTAVPGDQTVTIVEPGYQLSTVSDVGGDQGRQARVRWRRAPRDNAAMGATITGYSVWRRVDANKCAGSGAGNAPGPAVYPPGDWDYLKTVPACGEDFYGTVCPTVCDSSIAQGECWSVFFVRAHTANPMVFYDTPPDSGHSVDNLPPILPRDFAGHFPGAGEGLVLTWRANPESDVSHYELYRGLEIGFIPVPANLVGATRATQLTDPFCLPGAELHYKLCAVDRQGNRSPFAGFASHGAVSNHATVSAALAEPGRCLVRWRLQADAEASAFRVWRSVGQSEFARYADGQITSEQGEWLLTDQRVEPGLDYAYRVALMDGEVETVLFETGRLRVPDAALRLYPNHPNPFNPRTTITYSLPKAGKVTLGIYDVRGVRVATLVDGEVSAGEQSVEWRGTNDRGNAMPSGVYFARLQTSAGVQTVKATLAK